ncbi:MAG: hypothetical protein Kow006_09700 [Gammaproteobacteria bacterium]
MKRHRDVRRATLLLSLLAIGALGLLLSLLPESGVRVPEGSPESAEGAPETNRREHVVAELFRQGVAMLHTRRFELAEVPLHKLLQIAPRMPEAHVNMGFVQLGLERYGVAEDFFRTAIELRPTQENAYYGLAMALEGQQDIEAARGAMRTFIHLSDPDDPYRRRAQAAVWEWSEISREGGRNMAAVTPAAADKKGKDQQ